LASDDTLALSDALGDACDADDDNDGLADTVETAGPPCASASGPTNPLVQDTDGDRSIDGAECIWGSDPANAASKPTSGLGQGTPGVCPETANHDDDGDRMQNWFEALIGTDPCDADSDDDGVRDGTEYLGYASSPLGPADTDGDGLKDCVEIGDVNGNNVVNAQDLGIVASVENRTDRPVQDVDKNGTVNAADKGLVASLFGTTSTVCPH
jgi:hypothetical protein